jgi:molecular chaperone DnaJ
MVNKNYYEKDYYQILGVSKGADSAAIKKQYRKLARELHPDKTKGDKKLEDRFKAVSEAYEILGDDKKRREYDIFKEQNNSGNNPYGFQGKPENYQGKDFSDLFSFNDNEDLFATLFGFNSKHKGVDLQSTMDIGFKESILGTEIDIKLPEVKSKNESIKIRVPAGIKNGAKIKIKDKGAIGNNGRGDLYITINVLPHPIFTRVDNNIHLTLPITFTEAVLGADITIPTIYNESVKLRIKPLTSSGITLRIRNRGVKEGYSQGDLLVTISIVFPKKLSEEAKNSLKDYARATLDFNPRADLFNNSKI